MIIELDNKFDAIIDSMAKQLSYGDLMAAEAISKISVAIAKKRLELGKNQEEFAEYMGVTKSIVLEWESGNYDFSVETLAKICEQLGLCFEINFTDTHDEILEDMQRG